jgi:hypothetical protein
LVVLPCRQYRPPACSFKSQRGPRRH